MNPGSPPSDQDAAALLHDLQVHQIELAMQNEELRRASEQLDASKARYVELYDLAPVGYCSVNEAGLITQANLTLASLLGVPRSALVHRHFSSLVVSEDQNSWYRLWLRLQHLDAANPEPIELRLRRAPGSMDGNGSRKGGQPGASVWIQLAESDSRGVGGQRLMHMAVTDISANRQAEAVDQFLAQAGSAPGGEPFFATLARFLAESLEADYVSIDRLDGDAMNATALAVWHDGHFEDNPTSILSDSPRAKVVSQSACCYSAHVCEFFPHDSALKALRAESFAGVALRGHTGKPIGLIAVVGYKPMARPAFVEATLARVAVRAAGELERLDVEAALQASESRFRKMLQTVPMVAIQGYDQDGITRHWNQASEALYGFTEAEALGRSLLDTVIPPEMHEGVREAMRVMFATATPIPAGELSLRRKDGSRVDVFSSHVYVQVPGLAPEMFCVDIDLTERKKAEAQLAHMAHFDSLTHLPNRLLLADRLQQAMAQAQRRTRKLAVVYLDLDGFKAINDGHGHDVGDMMLRALANAMKDTLRDGDTLARIGGDEFVAVLVDLDCPESSMPLLKRLLGAACTPVLLGKQVLESSASAGVTFFPQAQSIEADQLLRQADQAMYQAKMAGKGRYHLFDAVQDSHLRGHHESLERIRVALTRGEFVLYYQPKVNLRTGQVIGAEALIRWQHPQNGLLAPAVFLPVIEDDPLTVDVGEWVIEAALTQMECWHAAGLDIPVSVNVGARQLAQADFVERLQSILAAHPDVNPANLELEVLETTALEDVVQVSQVIEACSRIGVMFALDDFGTGYSSLTYLRHLKVALIKIDQSFVRNMLTDADDLAILQGVIGLAAAFKRQVIAEGVETMAHGTKLLELGCDLVQGYGIARPMPGDEILTWMAGWRSDQADSRTT